MRYALNATTIRGVDQYLARRPRLVRIFTTGSPTGYRRRIEYPGLKGIWRSYFLLILYDDPPKGNTPSLFVWERPVTCVAQKMFWKKCNVNWK